MIDHDQALTLAAMSLDFSLDRSANVQLDEHLRECGECRAALAELRRDAARLAALPPIAPPTWVRGSLGKRRPSNPYMLLAAAAFLVTAAGLAIVVGTRLLDDRTAIVTPSALPTATLEASAAPTQSVVLEPPASFIPVSDLTWDPLTATGGGSGSVQGALSFKGSYITYGADQEGLTWASRSTDGRTWETVTLGLMVSPCPGYVVRPDSSIYAAATDGNQVILTGIESAMDVNPCDTSRAVAWISSDGLTWQRSEGFGAVNGFAEAIFVWAIPDGWETLVTGAGATPTRVWRSTDGLRWTWVSELDPGVSSMISTPVNAAADGTRLMALYNGEVGETIEGLRGGESILRISSDGKGWAPLDVALPFGRRVGASGILPPGRFGRDAWLLVTGADEQQPITWVSADLKSWEQGTFPRDDVASIALTRYGYIATGETLCGAGGTCSTDPVQYLSTDGLRWTEFAAPVGTVMVDGPAGVLAFAGPDFRVWILRPTTS